MKKKVLIVIGLITLIVIVYFLDKKLVVIEGSHKSNEAYYPNEELIITDNGWSSYNVEYTHRINGEVFDYKKWEKLKYKNGKLHIGGIYGDIRTSFFRDKIYFLNATFNNNSITPLKEKSPGPKYD